MTAYPTTSFTYGFEIEWGDIDRRLQIPPELGSWEFSETDVINMREPVPYVSCDPLGLEPTWGGEINTKPTKTWAEQVDRIMEIRAFFEAAGNRPTPSCVSHGHVHVRVPGLSSDIDALKRLIAYIGENQADAVATCGGYYDSPYMKGSVGAKQYLKYDGGRLMPDYMIANILEKANDFESFIRMHAAGKDGVSMGRPFRYAINTYSLKHIDTIEFRFFRSSIERHELESQMAFVEKFLDSALNGGPTVREILDSREWTFPPFVFDKLAYDGWVASKYDKSRGKKDRVLHHDV